MEQQDFDRDAWLARIKRTVLEVEPDATVLLYGSRARGDARPDSDWDFLVLLDGPVDYEREYRVRYDLYPLEWQTGRVINAIVQSREEWDRVQAKAVSFLGGIKDEALEL